MARRSENIDQWVGHRIGQLRRERGLSQTALAAALGLSFQQIQKYEAGLNRVSAARLYQLSRLLDCPVGGFFPPDDTSGAGADPDAQQAGALSEAYGRIDDPRLRRSVLDVVQALALG